jgi:hypothetical protein
MNKPTITVMGATFESSKGASDELNAFRARTAKREHETYMGYVHDIESSLHDLLYSFHKKNRGEITKDEMKTILKKLDTSDEKPKKNISIHEKLIYIVKTHWWSIITFAWIVCAIIAVALFIVSINENPTGYSGENIWYYGAPVDSTVIEPVPKEDVSMLLRNNLLFYSGFISLFTFAAVINFRAIRYLRWRTVSKAYNMFTILIVLFMTVWANINYTASQFLDRSTIEQNYGSLGIKPQNLKLALCGTSLEVGYGVDNYFSAIRNGATRQHQYAYDNTANREPLYSEQLCKDYFKLLEKYSNDEIVVMDFIIDEKGQEYPRTNQLGKDNANRPFSSKNLSEDLKRTYLGLYLK